MFVQFYVMCPTIIIVNVLVSSHQSRKCTNKKRPSACPQIIFPKTQLAIFSMLSHTYKITQHVYALCVWAVYGISFSQWLGFRKQRSWSRLLAAICFWTLSVVEATMLSKTNVSQFGRGGGVGGGEGGGIPKFFISIIEKIKSYGPYLLRVRLLGVRDRLRE